MSKDFSKSTLAVVVTFNPEIELFKKNIAALSLQFERILVVDNHSDNIEEIKTASKIVPTIKIKELAKNLGIAAAQNFGLKEAVAAKINWLLLMDQDSVIPDNLISEYQKIIDNNEDIGLVTWDPNSKKISQKIIENCHWIVSSGSLVSVSGLKSVGGFDDRLFIDHVYYPLYKFSYLAPAFPTFLRITSSEYFIPFPL